MSFVPEVISENTRQTVTNRRICVLVDSFYPIIGGGEIHTKTLCEHLIHKGLAVFVITRRRKKDNEDRDLVGDIPVYRVPPSGMPRWGKYLMFFPAFAKLVQMRRDYDVVYISVFRSIGILGLLVAKLLGKKCVLRAGVREEMSGRNFLDEYRHKKLGLPFIRVFLFIRNAILRQADGFVSISKAIQDDFRYTGVPTAKIWHIPNGVDTALFIPVSSDRRNILRHLLGLPNRKIFCFTGKLNKGKGLELLLDVWVSVADIHPEAHLLLVGGGENQFLSYENQLKNFVAKNRLEESITFTGYVPSVVQYLQAADFFVFPSESEGMPNSLLEALSCGLPVLASRIDGITDIVTHTVDALLFEARNREQLRECIDLVLNDPNIASRLGTSGRDTVERRFSQKTMVDEYYRLLTTIR